MSQKYPGGLITKSPITPSGPYETSTASGIWTLDQQAYWRKLNQWPIAGSVEPDPQFNYVTMLLHGDGTNGAQNNTFLDSSTNAFSITRNGNTTQGSFSPYGSNWSNYFDGDGDYLSIPDSSAFTMGSGDFTVELWFNATSTPSQKGLIGQGNISTPSTCSFFLDISTTTPRFFVLSGSTEYNINSSTDITAGTWNHLAGVRNGNTLYLYLNGVQVGTRSVTGVTINDSTTVLGIGRFGTTSAMDFNGSISNVRIVKGTAVYTSAFTPSTTPLTAITNTVLLTCQSNRFIDNSASPLTITANGTPSVQRFNPFGASTAYSTSVIGGSSFFPTANTGSDNLSIASTSALSFTASDDLTIESWVFLTAQNDYSYICSKGNSSTREYGFTVRASTIEFYWSTNGSLDSSVTASFTFQLGTWYHVAMSKSGTSVRLFVNGTQQGSTGTFTTIYNGSSPFRVGTFMDFTGISHCLAGYLSNLRIVKGTAVYTANFTPPTAPLTAITNTSLLTNFTNGAIFDNAMMNNLETVGNAQISTSVKKYGTGSIAFDGTGDYLTSNAPTNLNAFGTGDFTIEGWFYLNTTASQQVFLDFRLTDSSVAGALYFDGTNVSYYVLGANRISGGTISTSTWYHVAVCRSGTSTKLFINGAQVGSTYTDTNNYICPIGRPYLGALSDGTGTLYYNGYMDDIRITKGYARYTANFTPPTAAFLNIGPT